MPASLVGAALLAFTQLTAPALPSAAQGPVPTLADPPASQVAFAETAATPTLAEPPLAPAEQAFNERPQAPGSTIPAAAAPEMKPGELMRSLVQPEGASSLRGRPTQLADVLATAQSRREQTERTAAYWALSAAATDYYLAEREATGLAALRQEAPTAAQASAEWDAREREVDARTRLAQQEVTAAQSRLQAMLGADPAAEPPLAADVPHCGRYETRYSEIFTGGDNPAARQLAETVDLRHIELRAEAEAAAAASDWLVRARQQAASGDGTVTIRAFELLNLRLREFVATARAYNQEIAAYAELAAPGNVGTERLVAMLIHTTDPADEIVQQPAAMRQDSQVTPAAAYDPLNHPPAPTLAEEQGQQQLGGQQPVDPQSPPAEREGLFGRRTEARRPMLRQLFEREHSILLPRLRPRTN